MSAVDRMMAEPTGRGFVRFRRWDASGRELQPKEYSLREAEDYLDMWQTNPPLFGMRDSWLADFATAIELEREQGNG